MEPRVLDRYFRLTEKHTTVRRELVGGLTTFLTMAYIVVVNPQILSQAGMPAEGVVFATCIASAAATLVMGLYANYPIALAPGMSLNAYFTYSVCLGMHVPWRTALGVIFFSGVFFLVLTVTRIREQIVNGIPDCLKYSTAAGIGMFIAFVGLRNAKLVVANPATFVGLGSFSAIYEEVTTKTFVCQEELCVPGASHLIQQVTLRHFAKRRQLAAPPLVVAIQLPSHQFHHSWRHAEGCPGVQEQCPRAPRQDILQVERQFVPHGPDDFRAGIRQRPIQRLGPLRIALLQLLHHPGIGAVHPQVAELLRRRVEAVYIQMPRDARFIRQLCERGRLVDAIFRHAAIGGPLASADCHHPR